MDSKASNTKELMDINNLKYEEPAELALVESGGVFKKNNADQQVYTSNAGTELICTLQSSTDFVYGPNCYLRFDVEAKGATTGDPAANNGGWQWSAGTGTDAAPYFRIFNPISQGKKFDPDGDYIRTWVPELAHVATKFIHEPWKMSIDDQS